MLAIDADAHVIETEHTWDYLEGRDKRFRPVPISPGMPSGKTQNFWIINGKLIGGRDNIGLDTPKESRDMADIEARLKHMDEIGTDIQVLYPTLFLRPVTDRPDIEAALCRSYNRWLADIWTQGKGRLRWAAQLPLLTMDEALEELRWTHEHGACVVFMRGLEAQHPLHHPYFYPLYDEASRLDMPIGIHSGIGNAMVTEAFGNDPFRTAKLTVVGAIHALMMRGIPERFPKLRIGAIEVSAQWVPYVVKDVALRNKKRGVEDSHDVLATHRIYVACQTDDDLPYVLKYAGEDMIMIGSDYGHADNASELLALKGLRQAGEVAPRVIDKILHENPARFYGISAEG
jgi:uncharacterized protein